MTTLLVLPENVFNIEVYSRSTWFHFELNLSKFSGFLWKKTCKKKKGCINYFDEQEKPWIFFKIFQKKKQKIQSRLFHSRIEVKLKNQMHYLWFHDYSYNANQTENMTYP